MLIVLLGVPEDIARGVEESGLNIQIYQKMNLFRGSIFDSILNNQILTIILKFR